MIKLFDTHTHINNDTYTDEERDLLIEEIRNSDVKKIVDVGFDWPSTLLAVKHAKENDFIYAAIGVHPHDSKTMTEDMLNGLRSMVLEDRLYLHVKDDATDFINQNSGNICAFSENDNILLNHDPEGAVAFCQEKIVAIGEIGLDYHYDLSPRDDQRYWFRRQIRLANELKMPIVVHSREADRETMDILIEEGAFSKERLFLRPKRQVMMNGKIVEVPDAAVDIHCYSGSAEFAKEYIKLGATFGVDGPLTYKNNHKTVEVVETVPLELLLIETDAPYLTPVPYRGKPNKSPYVEYVARKIAEIKGLTYEEVAETTFTNATKFYGLASD